MVPNGRPRTQFCGHLAGFHQGFDAALIAIQQVGVDLAELCLLQPVRNAAFQELAVVGRVSPPTNFCQRARISAVGRSGNLAICAATDGGVESDVLVRTP